MTLKTYYAIENNKTIHIEEEKPKRGKHGVSEIEANSIYEALQIAKKQSEDK